MPKDIYGYNLELYKFLGRRVKDKYGREYSVLGIFWDSEHILLAGRGHVHYSELELVPEDEDT